MHVYLIVVTLRMINSHHQQKANSLFESHQFELTPLQLIACSCVSIASFLKVTIEVVADIVARIDEVGKTNTQVD